jgi:hypothetical protein
VRSSPVTNFQRPGKAARHTGVSVMKPFSAASSVLTRTGQTIQNKTYLDVAKAVQRSTVCLWTGERRFLRLAPSTQGFCLIREATRSF